MDNVEYLISRTALHNINLTKEQATKIVDFLNFLVKYNENVNLTSILNFKDMVYKHIIDSLLIFNVLNIRENMNLLDVGAGAGFPSTPIAIVEKFKNILQIDSSQKKIDFLIKVRDMFNLKIEIKNIRAEYAAKLENFREKFCVVTARAVAKLNILCEYCIPFVKLGGFFVALKGPNYEDELVVSKKAINVLGGKLIKAEKFELLNNSTRVFIVIEKVARTPFKYPRNYSKILKNPI